MPDRPDLSEVLDLLLDAVCVVDREGRFVYVSAAGERIFGYPPEAMRGRRMIELVAPEDRPRTLEASARVMAGNPLPHFENHYVHRLGHRVPIMWTARWSEAHGMRIAVARDITERRRAEQLHHALFALSEAAHETRDLHALLGRTHAILDGLLPDSHCEVVLRDNGQDRLHYLYRSERHPTAGIDPAADPFLAGVIEAGRARRSNDGSAGSARSGSRIGVPLVGESSVIGCIALERDPGRAGFGEDDLELLRHVSRQVAAAIERNRLHARLERLAHFDALTGLPNRSLLIDRVEVAIARAERHGHQLALLFVDLDGFKQINDERGHAAGDRLLQETAHRLQRAVRSCDTVARIGGDEFVILIEDLVEPQGAQHVADSIGRQLQASTDGVDPLCGASVGIALYPRDGVDVYCLLARADKAMYEAKRARRRPVRLSGA
ncbi:diguanylate cyclase domain-containing protein [Pseudomarimonas salicorniae]|uniref:Diguanylate cyclase n=1 Tax=Pseudomarimonas salicorniae TaxID=2933270 RepID=A0ABT0GLY0_9GAMM|nr:diguanylate cyclase [Lysobacter sp. CAU 1642]